jgi:hypothetical protein
VTHTSVTSTKVSGVVDVSRLCVRHTTTTRRPVVGLVVDLEPREAPVDELLGRVAGVAAPSV